MFNSQARAASALVLGVLLVGAVVVIYDAEREQAVPEAVLSDELGRPLQFDSPPAGRGELTEVNAGESESSDDDNDDPVTPTPRDTEWLRAWKQNSKGFSRKGTADEEAWYKSWRDASNAPLDTNMSPPRPRAKLRHTVQSIYRSWSRRVWKRRAQYQQKIDDVQALAKLHVAARVAQAHVAEGKIHDKYHKEELAHRANQAKRRLERSKMATSVAQEANKATAAAVAKAPAPVVAAAPAVAASGDVAAEKAVLESQIHSLESRVAALEGNQAAAAAPAAAPAATPADDTTDATTDAEADATADAAPADADAGDSADADADAAAPADAASNSTSTLVTRSKPRVPVVDEGNTKY